MVWGWAVSKSVSLIGCLIVSYETVERNREPMPFYKAQSILIDANPNWRMGRCVVNSLIKMTHES